MCFLFAYDIYLVLDYKNDDFYSIYLSTVHK